MSIVGGFFNAKNVNGLYDRVYNAEDFAAYFANFISSGVFAQPSNQMKVVPGGGLSVDVSVGKGYIKGYWVDVPQTHHLTVSPNMTGQTEQIKVVCKIDFGNRVPVLEVQENVESLLPENDYELVLATFSLQVGESEITTAMITDRRPDETYCGFVTGLVDQIDFTELMSQQQAQFNEWFNDMKGQLSEDAAGNLQQQIDDMEVNLSKTMVTGASTNVDYGKKSKGMIEPPDYGYGMGASDTPYFLSNVVQSSKNDRTGWIKKEDMGYYLPVPSSPASGNSGRAGIAPAPYEDYEDANKNTEQGEHYAKTLMMIGRYENFGESYDYASQKNIQKNLYNWGDDYRYFADYTYGVLLQMPELGDGITEINLLNAGYHVGYTPFLLGICFYTQDGVCGNFLQPLDVINRMFTSISDNYGLTYKYVSDLMVGKTISDGTIMDNVTATPFFTELVMYNAAQAEVARYNVKLTFHYRISGGRGGLGVTMKTIKKSGAYNHDVLYRIYGVGASKINTAPLCFNYN